jgi:hypothetical protein
MIRNNKHNPQNKGRLELQKPDVEQSAQVSTIPTMNKSGRDQVEDTSIIIK